MTGVWVVVDAVGVVVDVALRGVVVVLVATWHADSVPLLLVQIVVQEVRYAHYGSCLLALPLVFSSGSCSSGEVVMVALALFPLLGVVECTGVLDVNRINTLGNDSLNILVTLSHGEGGCDDGDESEEPCSTSTWRG